MKPLIVLVTDASYKHAVGIIRALGIQGHTVIATGHHNLSPGRFSRYTSYFQTVPDPSANPESYSSNIRSCCREFGVDLVIPVGFMSYRAIVRSQAESDISSAQILLPSCEQFEIASDKWEMITKATALGIPVPESALASTVGSPRQFGTHHPCFVIKPRSESLGKRVTVIHANDTLRASPQESCEDERREPPESLILQEYVPGHGEGYFALAINGQVVREYTHRRLREWPPDGGVATAAITTDHSQLKYWGRQLIQALSWTGPAMVEFRVGERGAYFIEFNPKFWGSLELGLAAGADFPGDLCRWAIGEDLSARRMPPYHAGLRFWWPWRGDLRRLVFRPKDALSILRDLVSLGTDSNWYWSDPVPNLIEVGGELLYPIRRHG